MELDYKNMFVTIETGGSIGEIANHGHYRVAGDIYANKKEAIAHTKRMSNMWGGGYYDYHYSTKTVDWAIKNCKNFKPEEAIVIP